MEQAGEMRDTEVMPLLYVQPSVRPWGGAGGWKAVTTRICDMAGSILKKPSVVGEQGQAHPGIDYSGPMKGMLA